MVWDYMVLHGIQQIPPSPYIATPVPPLALVAPFALLALTSLNSLTIRFKCDTLPLAFDNWQANKSLFSELRGYSENCGNNSRSASKDGHRADNFPPVINHAVRGRTLMASLDEVIAKNRIKCSIQWPKLPRRGPPTWGYIFAMPLQRWIINAIYIHFNFVSVKSIFYIIIIAAVKELL